MDSPASPTGLGTDRPFWKRIDLFPYMLLAPMFVLLGAFLVVPWVVNASNSFYDWKLNDPTSVREFAGLQNFRSVLTDEITYRSLRNTLVFVGAGVVLEVVLGMIGALLLFRTAFMKRVLSTLVLSPMLLTPVAVGLMWVFMWNALFGIINYLLSMIGIQGPAWLADPSWTLWTLVITEVWQHTSYMILILLAGLHGLPKDPYESAKIDGANSWQAFWSITVPLLRPILAIGIMFRLMFAIRTFDVPYVLLGLQGGPDQSGLLFSTLLYRVSFQSFDVGRSAALALILVVVTGVLVFTVTKLVYKEVEL
jgi:multiple sugar transport system permease protein